jgi:hypothetical protein
MTTTAPIPSNHDRNLDMQQILQKSVNSLAQCYHQPKPSS